MAGIVYIPNFFHMIEHFFNNRTPEISFYFMSTMYMYQHMDIDVYTEFQRKASLAADKHNSNFKSTLENTNI